MNVFARYSDYSSWLLAAEPASRLQARLGGHYRNWLTFRGNTLAMSGLVIVLGLILVALLAPLTGDMNAATHQVLANRLLPPSASHWFGTDELGREIFNRIAYGARVTLVIVTMVALIVLPIGVGIGTAAGYFGGVIDVILMRFTDVFLAFPRLVLALALAAALGPGIENAVIAIGLTAWPPYARTARAETLAIRNADYVLATQLQGASSFRIVSRYIVPLCLPSVIIRLTLDMSGIIITAASLGFLGLGAQPPLPEWGAMIATGRQFLLDQWWVATIPGIAIFFVSLGFNLSGDGLRDAFDPRSVT
jgi:peptide/nickel transport system permease protein